MPQISPISWILILLISTFSFLSILSNTPPLFNIQNKTINENNNNILFNW